MSKKRKILISLILIICIIGLVWGICTIVRFCTIQSIYGKVKEFIKYDNYYFKTSLTDKEKTTVTEAFYRDGIGKLLAENGIYTWVSANRAYMVDEETQKAYVLETDENALIVSYDMFASIIPGYNKNIFERILLAGNVSNKIKTVTEGEQKLILVQIKEKNVIKTIWIDKESSKPVKASIEFSNGDILQYKYELKFNVVKSKEVALPDLTQYTLVDNVSNEITNN